MTMPRSRQPVPSKPHITRYGRHWRCNAWKLGDGVHISRKDEAAVRAAVRFCRNRNRPQ